MTRICSTCGHPIPDAAAAARLVGKQKHFYEIVADAGTVGISSQDIMRKLYADDPAGGPESPNILSVMARIVNLHLERHGVAIKGRSGPGALYRLVALDGAEQ
jgi:hypothetical protein